MHKSIRLCSQLTPPAYTVAPERAQLKLKDRYGRHSLPDSDDMMGGNAVDKRSAISEVCQSYRLHSPWVYFAYGCGTRSPWGRAG